MVDAVLALPEDTKLMILSPVIAVRKGENGETLHIVQIGSFPNKLQATQISTKLPKGVYRVELYIGEGVAGHTAD